MLGVVHIIQKSFVLFLFGVLVALWGIYSLIIRQR